jgi:hypothetical protein
VVSGGLILTELTLLVHIPPSHSRFKQEKERKKERKNELPAKRKKGDLPDLQC